VSVGSALTYSVVTPTHKRAENLVLLLDSLAAQRLPKDRFEVIVVDDASGDRTGDVLRAAQASKLPNLRYESFERNGGPARARNRGIELASGDVVVFLDDDVAAAPDLLAEHAAFHDADADPKRALLGRVDWHPSLKVTRFMRWLDASGLQFAYDAGLEEGEVDAPYLVFYMANISIWRSSLQEVGGFDERFPGPAYEDYELGWRLAQRGLTLAYRPQARAFHTRGIDLKTFRRRTAMVAESAMFLRSLHPDFPLAESLTKDRLSPSRRRKLFAFAPVARLIGDDVRLGRVYRELVAESYAEGRRRALERLREQPD
jgi:glycosyltransferase involved in cell wall biosynthesis